MKSLFKIFNYFLIGLLGVCPTLSRTSSSHTLCALLGDDSLNYSEVDKKTLKEIEGLVDEILKIKSENSSGDVSEIEKEIDKIVYKLYNLNDGEIRIVEGV